MQLYRKMIDCPLDDRSNDIKLVGLVERKEKEREFWAKPRQFFKDRSILASKGTNFIPYRSKLCCIVFYEARNQNTNFLQFT